MQCPSSIVTTSVTLSDPLPMQFMLYLIDGKGVRMRKKAVGAAQNNARQSFFCCCSAAQAIADMFFTMLTAVPVGFFFLSKGLKAKFGEFTFFFFLYNYRLIHSNNFHMK